MGRVSITISYSSRCLATETVKYINDNSFIENLAASKYSMWHREANKCNNKQYRHVQKKCSCENVNRFVSVNCSVQRKRSNGNLVFLLHVSNRHEQVL